MARVHCAPQSTPAPPAPTSTCACGDQQLLQDSRGLPPWDKLGRGSQVGKTTAPSAQVVLELQMILAPPLYPSRLLSLQLAPLLVLEGSW